jgi:hypothetical protein
MEHHSQTKDTVNTRKIFEGQLRECFGRVVYSHKTHEKCADILIDQLSKIKLAQMILSALTTGGFIMAIASDEKWGNIAGVIISTILLIINAYTKDYDLGELAQKHKQSANDLLLIRENYISLITDIRMQETPIEKLQEKRDEILSELSAIYSGAPSTNYKAYKKAQEALKQGEDMTFSDDEIDAFLPKELKSTTEYTNKSQKNDIPKFIES